MKKAGVDYSVLLPIATKPSQTEVINNWAASICGDGIIAFGSIHPDHTEWKKELKRIKDLGLKGIKLHPDYQLFYIDDKRMYPIYEYMFSLGLVLVFHAGRDIGLPEPYHCTPDRLYKLVCDFNGAKIIAAHMGSFAYWDDVEKYLVGTDIYFDTSYSLGCISDDQAKRIILNHGYEKVLFATDSPWTDQSEEIDKLRNLKLGTKAESAILGENACKLLGGKL
ncbi:amidohydrolase family protein [Pseudobacteroides cellulosolvens]|uniref:Amidohydrolase 2 n=1 Tax=Pseudobacteroides cellulosolvens ATCC 35603 = DSM 2933 TaxID=398512 RepID=A0A0L6JPV1_9FIRM|nr:amidohydrolase family protein [Pseudobacteroides cellulosolvens]KNY27412.1 amidohydrolase 2 [Pseudobacteroides cellulosolvens ATCC 35603 = DSM 2933]